MYTRRLPFPAFIILCGVLLFSHATQGQVSVLTYQNDNSRSGQNPNETLLTPVNVNANHFGKLFSYDADGFIVGQPLYVPNVTIPDSGTYNVVYVATQHDSVYAFDADNAASGTPLWTVSFIDPADGITTIPIGVQGCGNATMFTEIGIMGTPVIDPNSGTLYVVAKTVENGVFYFRLHALDYATGAERPGSPVVIGGSASGATFGAQNEIQRPALLLNNGVVYVAFGSNGCDTGAQGWVIAYDSTTLQQLGIYCTEPQQPWGANIWDGGSGPAADSTGSIYFSTANGIFDGNVGGLDYSDSVLRLALGTDGLTLGDYFTPYDQLTLGSHDRDLGSGGVLTLPDQAEGEYPHLLVTAGKQGTVYLINRDNMGQYNSVDNSQIVENLPNAVNHQFGGPLYFNNTVYFAAKNDAIKAFGLVDGLLSTTPIAQSALVTTLGVPSISANGTNDAVLWLVLATINGDVGHLAAFTADTLSLLYDSTQRPDRDAPGSLAHFVPVTVANGRVYLGTESQLIVYGLLEQDTAVSGNCQSGKPGETLPLLLTVQVLDSYTGAPVAGQTITFDDGGVGGVFDNPMPVTDTNGLASTSYTLPSNTGGVIITAAGPSTTTAHFFEYSHVTATPYVTGCTGCCLAK